MHEELVALNQEWRASFFGQEHKDALEASEGRGVRFEWDIAPNGMLRFVARDARDRPLAFAVAWPGACKTALIDMVLRDLKFLASLSPTAPHEA